MDLITLEYVDVIDNKKKKLQFSKYLISENCSYKSLFVLRVDGESMQPLILNNSLVVADLSQKEFKENDIFIISKDGKFWIKKAVEDDCKKRFVSINKKFSHLCYSFDEVRIIAKVVLTFTKF